MGIDFHFITLSLRMNVAAHVIAGMFEANLNRLAACTACGLQVFSAKLTESINALDGGYITTLNTQEVVLQTFTGKVRGRHTKWMRPCRTSPDKVCNVVARILLIT